MALGSLAAHVSGEHLGQWEEGAALLGTLTEDNVKIAEVRLAHTHLAAGDADVALSHARAALALCDEEDAPDEHRFYPWVAEALALHAREQRGAALDAAGKAERALATMDAGQWPAAQGDFDALQDTLGHSGDAVQ